MTPRLSCARPRGRLPGHGNNNSTRAARLVLLVLVCWLRVERWTVSITVLLAGHLFTFPSRMVAVADWVGSFETLCVTLGKNICCLLFSCADRKKGLQLCVSVSGCALFARCRCCYLVDGRGVLVSFLFYAMGSGRWAEVLSSPADISDATEHAEEGWRDA